MSVLLVCFACGHQQQVFWARTEQRICSNCRARHPILVRNERAIGKRAHWIEWADKPGIPARDAYVKTHGGLRWIQEMRNYKLMWIELKFLKIFGFLATDDIIPLFSEAPTAALMYWVHRDNLEWRRHKQADERADQAYVERVDERISDLLPCFMTPEDWGVKL